MQFIAIHAFIHLMISALLFTPLTLQTENFPLLLPHTTEVRQPQTETEPFGGRLPTAGLVLKSARKNQKRTETENSAAGSFLTDIFI